MKQTLKFVRAMNLYKQLEIKSKYSSQDELYTLLVEHNYHWDSKQKSWLDGGVANPVSEVIKIRVMTDKTKVKTVATEVKEALSDRWTCLETSDLCPCRPPKQNDARIYLTFVEKSSVKASKFPKNTDAVLGGAKYV